MLGVDGKTLSVEEVDLGARGRWTVGNRGVKYIDLRDRYVLVEFDDDIAHVYPRESLVKAVGKFV